MLLKRRSWREVRTGENTPKPYVSVMRLLAPGYRQGIAAASCEALDEMPAATRLHRTACRDAGEGSKRDLGIGEGGQGREAGRLQKGSSRYVMTGVEMAEHSRVLKDFTLVLSGS